MSDSLLPRGLKPARLLGAWDSPGKNTGVGSRSLLQGIILTHGSNPDLLHCGQILYHLSHRGSPEEGEGGLNLLPVWPQAAERAPWRLSPVWEALAETVTPVCDVERRLLDLGDQHMTGLRAGGSVLTLLLLPSAELLTTEK